MLKLKLQYFGYFMWRVDSLENSLMLGGIGGRRRRGWQKTRWLDGITNSVDMNLSRVGKIVEDRGAWHATVHGVTKSQTLLSNWTTARLYSLVQDHKTLVCPVFSEGIVAFFHFWSHIRYKFFFSLHVYNLPKKRELFHLCTTNSTINVHSSATKQQ